MDLAFFIGHLVTIPAVLAALALATAALKRKPPSPMFLASPTSIDPATFSASLELLRRTAQSMQVLDNRVRIYCESMATLAHWHHDLNLRVAKLTDFAFPAQPAKVPPPISSTLPVATPPEQAQAHAQALQRETESYLAQIAKPEVPHVDRPAPSVTGAKDGGQSFFAGSAGLTSGLV